MRKSGSKESCEKSKAVRKKEKSSSKKISSKRTERGLETRIGELVQRAGGLFIKLDASTCQGILDRLVILPGLLFLLELKRPSTKTQRRGTIQKNQHYMLKRLHKMECPAFVCDSVEGFNAILEKLRDGKTRRTGTENESA